MKFPIDTFSELWVGSPTAIMSNIDPTYLIANMNEKTKGSFIVALVILMNLYYMSLIVLYVIGVEYGQGMARVRKIVFLLYRHIVIPPSFGLLIK